MCIFFYALLKNVAAENLEASPSVQDYQCLPSQDKILKFREMHGFRYFLSLHY